MRPSQGFWEQGNKAIYFRGTREQKPKTEGNRGTKAQDVDFGEQGKMDCLLSEPSFKEVRVYPSPLSRQIQQTTK